MNKPTERLLRGPSRIPGDTAQVIAIPTSSVRSRHPLRPSELGPFDAWLSSRGEEIVQQLERWEPPFLPDEVIDAWATIFLMQRGHEVMPFFAWLEQHLTR